jgi:hypothetical protein
MSAIKLSTPSSGSISLTPADTASNLTITVPAATATMAIDGPAFSAYLASNQTISANTWTKVTINTEEFDTASCYDNSTNYRFTPTVAGYYQVNAATNPSGATASYVAIYKNGTQFKSGYGSSSGASLYGCPVSALIYLNGSTDYIEFYAQQSNTTINSGIPNTYFQASMVRAA